MFPVHSACINETVHKDRVCYFAIQMHFCLKLIVLFPAQQHGWVKSELSIQDTGELPPSDNLMHIS